LLTIRDERLKKAREAGKLEILEELVFPSPDGSILDPDNLYHRYFLPVLAKAGIRKIRLHDLRHTFGSQLIQSGASIVYVKEQMGHYSIQVTVDTYGHLIPGANVSYVDRLDSKPKKRARKAKEAISTQRDQQAQAASNQ
jgi:integrase